MIQRWIAAAVVLVACTQLLAASPGNAKVSARLVTDVGKIESGKPFPVAALLVITPGWHVYWKNPGESGLPTTVALKMPDGFTATAFEYPVPSVFDIGGVKSYGYENQVALLATVTPPANVEGTPEIEATVSFLVCSNVCLPGKLMAKLETGVDEATSIVYHTRGEIPVRSKADAKWTTSKTDDGWTHMELHVDQSADAWFPNPPEGVLIRDPQIKGAQRAFGGAAGPVEHGTTISFDTKKQGGADVKEKSFESVLSYIDFTREAGDRRGLIIDVPTPP
jgi:DsbC/DsbD-like thiol-disulfide interchange protein